MPLFTCELLTRGSCTGRCKWQVIKNNGRPQWTAYKVTCLITRKTALRHFSGTKNVGELKGGCTTFTKPTHKWIFLVLDNDPMPPFRVNTLLDLSCLVYSIKATLPLAIDPSTGTAGLKFTSILRMRTLHNSYVFWFHFHFVQ